MCWSGEASTVIAVAGAAATVYSIRQRQAPALYVPLGYFTAMEVLQSATYRWLDDCASPANQITTLLGYLHICFQPFFINMFSLHFVPQAVREKVSMWVYGLCMASVVVMIVQLYPFDWAGSCDGTRRTLCGQRLCAFTGTWHLAWSLPLNGIGNDMLGIFLHKGHPTYVLVGFVVPVLYGSWRITGYHYLTGAFLAGLLTSNLNEWPAVWCLLSVALIVVIVTSPLRNWLRVTSWPLWPKRWGCA